MATQLFLLDSASSKVPDTHLGTDNATLIGANTGWRTLALGTSRGTFAEGGQANTVTGPTAGVEVLGSVLVSGAVALPLEWISPPVSADVTIAGTITCNIWGFENNMSANVAAQMVIEVIRASTTTTRNSNTLVQIAKSAFGTELVVSTTTTAVNNFTVTPTSTVVNRGDRLRVRIFGDDISGSNMASPFTFALSFGGTTASVDGDTYVTFTENFSFESAPAGSVLYLTDTASDVATASVDREAWTSRGAGVQTDVTNTSAGWVTPIQVTDTAGGTVVDWFTKQLTAFTLTGKAVANIRAQESNALGNASLRCQIARVASDGTSPTVWADWAIAPTTTDDGELTTSEVARTCNVSGDDLAFTDGQRIRIRLYVDDISSAAMGASQTVTTYYAGTSAAASGDTYITLPQSVTEYVAGGAAGSSFQTRRQRRASRFLTFR